jgi:hypothetical protein
MKKRGVLLLGMLAVVLVFGMTVGGWASYMEWYYSTLPGGREQHDRQVAEINDRYRDSSSGGNSSSSGSSNRQANDANVRNAVETYYQDLLRRYNWPQPGTFNEQGRGSGYTNNGGGYLYTFTLTEQGKVVHSETVDFTPR